jgi:hypothetical protein
VRWPPTNSADTESEDGVADNQTSGRSRRASLLFGRNFGTATDISTGPDGDLYVVPLSHGNVYEIHRR